MQNRKVAFKHRKTFTRTEEQLIQMFEEIPAGTGYKATRGTGFDGFKKNNLTYEMEVEDYGYFIDFGIDCIESEDGNVNFTVAMVEGCDGEVHMVYPSHMRFLPADYSNNEYRDHKRIFGF